MPCACDLGGKRNTPDSLRALSARVRTASAASRARPPPPPPLPDSGHVVAQGVPSATSTPATRKFEPPVRIAASRADVPSYVARIGLGPVNLGTTQRYKTPTPMDQALLEVSNQTGVSKLPTLHQQPPFYTASVPVPGPGPNSNPPISRAHGRFEPPPLKATVASKAEAPPSVCPHSIPKHAIVTPCSIVKYALPSDIQMPPNIVILHIRRFIDFSCTTFVVVPVSERAVIAVDMSRITKSVPDLAVRRCANYASEMGFEATMLR